MKIAIKKFPDYFRASIEYPNYLRSKSGCYIFEAFGETIPKAVLMAAQHAQQEIIITKR